MIGRRERWSYAAGDLGFNFVWQSVELYLLFYYVRGLGLSPYVASAIFLAGAAVDWIADPLVGALADRSRWSLRAWMLIGGPLSVLLLAITFTPPPVASGWVPAAATLSYLALRFAYSIGNIPYAALTARISAEPADHLALTGSRMQGAAIGGLVAALVYAMLPSTRGGGADFRDGALLLALLALPAFFACYAGVRERVTRGRPESMPREWAARSLIETLRLLGRSPELRRVLAVILTSGVAVTVVNKSLLFLFAEMGEPRIGFYVALVPSASLLLTAPAWTSLGARLGRPRALLLAALLKIGAILFALLAGGLAAVIAAICIAIIAGCGVSIMFWSLVPTAVADCEAHATQSECAGRVYALSNIARKLAQALAPQVIALSLAGSASSILLGALLSAAAALAVILCYGPRIGQPASAFPALREEIA